MTIDIEIGKLKRLNLIAGALHLVSLLGILFLANDAKLPVNAIYLTEAPGTGNFSDPINFFNLNISYMVAAFLALSAFFHFFISSPAMFNKYAAGLKNHINVCMILFGWLQEKYTTPGDGDLLPFWFGCIAGSIPWIAALINLISPKGPAEATPPGFVWGIVISLFILFNFFAIVQYKQYKAQGKWSNYLRGERAYIVLSLVAKSLLAWQVFAGTLAS